jgi:hypothetical protein
MTLRRPEGVQTATTPFPGVPNVFLLCVPNVLPHGGQKGYEQPLRPFHSLPYTKRTPVCVCVCGRAGVRACVCVCVRAGVRVCVHTYTRTHTCLYIHTHAHTHVCVHTYTRTHTCVYIHTHAHTHVCVHALLQKKKKAPCRSDRPSCNRQKRASCRRRCLEQVSSKVDRDVCK